MAAGEALRAVGEPRNVGRIAALVLAGLMLGLGLVQLGVLGEPCRTGEAAGTGTVDRIEAAGSPRVTTLTLRGSPTPYRFGTDLTGAFRQGDFVVVCGAPAPSGVAATTIRHAQDPASAAGPYLAGGAVVAACLALDVAMPRLVALPWPQRGAIFGRRASLWLRRRRGADGGGTADNHSGAPAPKG